MTFYEKSAATTPPAREMTWAVLPERMTAIPLEKMTDAQKQVAADVAASPRGSVRGPFKAMMRSPKLMDRMQKLGAYIRFECDLDKRVAVMAGLMVARHWTNQYIWNGHVRQALERGVDQAVIDAIAEGRRPTAMSDVEEITYDFLTELLANKGVSDKTYERAVAKLGEAGVVELLGVTGYFSTNAMILNVSRTPLREGKPTALASMPQQFRPVS